MIEVIPLYSSSSGNSFLIKIHNKYILIDCGCSYKNIVTALNHNNIDVKKISAILITHEHSDHIKGLDIFYKNNPNILIYSTYKTICEIKNKSKYLINCTNFNKIEYNKEFRIENIEATFIPFETSHDAVEPCGYYICSDILNDTLTFATDLGYVTDEILDYLIKSRNIIIESNYDKQMLDYGGYPFLLKQRIKGNLGHLSNKDCTDTIINVLNNKYNFERNFYISHMSRNNNMLDIATQTLGQGLKDCNINLKNNNIFFIDNYNMCRMEKYDEYKNCVYRQT